MLTKSFTIAHIVLCIFCALSNIQRVNSLNQQIPYPSLDCALALTSWENDTEHFVESALIMLDSTAKNLIGSDLGSKDDCSLVSYRAHYCLAYLSTPVPHSDTPLTSYLGLCIPKQCQEHDIKMAWSYLTIRLGIPTAVNSTVIASCSMSEVQYDGGKITILFFLALFVALAIAGTAADIIIPPKVTRITSINSSEEPFLDSSLPRRNMRDSVIIKFITCWSVYSNFPRLFAEVADKTKFLNGIRVLSMFYIILGHTNDYYISHSVPEITNYPFLMLEQLPKFSFQFVLGAFFAVDSFFYLSALLAATQTVESIAKRGASAKYWAMYFFHRVWRLIPTYAFVMFFWYNAAGIFGYGPLFYFPQTRSVDPNCEKYWWTNLLFINNYVPWDDNFVNECMIWTWYIAVDMQLFIIAAPVLWLWVKNKIAAIIAIIVFIIGGTIAVIILTAVHDLQYFEITTFHTWDLLYTKPWLRFAPYFIGTATGIYFSTGLPKPEGRIWLPIFYVLAAGLIIAPIIGTYSYFQENNSWTTTENVFYLAFSRPAFTIGLTFLCVPMFYGYAQPVRELLSADFFSPLARLTFSAYLLHPIIMFIAFINTESVEVWTPISVAIYFTAFVVFAYFFALIVWLLVEKPFMNLEKFWIPPREKEK